MAHNQTADKTTEKQIPDQQGFVGYESQPHVQDGWVPPCCRPAKKSKLRAAMDKLSVRSQD
ncbi:hypothetical protein SAMN05443377_11254 [Propionibacterium cyclohexanicum]|uniref:Uncharacterized protein n=1 Tax=Propionibacterium cyclohexanicum TaxID=64702 RepID=A0A1H9SBR5_9ACTN|nr:hypothetical protein [Propionibacterium cyclohexanicum]SER82452.1 hypothetical protein SAMN05443377_11254 [Propionibacterium cyclohexanicum]